MTTKRLLLIALAALLLVGIALLFAQPSTRRYRADSMVVAMPYTNTFFARSFESHIIRTIPGVLALRVTPTFKVAHALEALGQDVLEKAMEKTLRLEPHGSSLAAATVAVTEGDDAAVVVENTLGTEGGAIQVSGEVLEGGLAPADGLHIGHPIDRPDWAGDLEEELGMVLLEGSLEPCA